MTNRRCVWRWLSVLAVVLSPTAPLHAAESASLSVRTYGLAVAAGSNLSSKVEYYALHPQVGLSLWEAADRWFEARDIEAHWIIEPWVAFVRDAHGSHQTESFEIGVSPLFARLTLGHTALRPFIEGGEGILYTDLRGQDLGTRVQVSSQIGAGLEYGFGPDLTLTVAGRLRHISNMGFAKVNPGINTIFGMVGFAFR